jgi:hypothetical protein
MLVVQQAQKLYPISLPSGRDFSANLKVNASNENYE